MLWVFFKCFFNFYSLEQHLKAKKWEGRWGTGGGGTIYIYICSMLLLQRTTNLVLSMEAPVNVEPWALGNILP